MATDTQRFVELDRDFLALKGARKYRIDDLDHLDLFGPCGLKWADLLDRDRVVVLAGAESGKTQEFRERVRRLREDSEFAQYITIERLARDGFEIALNLEERRDFERWQAGSATGWFFLDSVDEARINHEDVETALNRFAHALGAGYDRAHIMLSCRGSSWEGEADLALVTRTLPLLKEKLPPIPVDPDEALFAKPEREDWIVAAEVNDNGRSTVTVVAMTKLSAVQRSLLVSRQRIGDPAAFMDDVLRHGLDRFAERPGDLRALARYWGQHGKFGTLGDMTEFAIGERLREHDPNRDGARLITEVDARHGVERLAASMTLAQTMELVLPTDEVGGTDGVDPYRVLADWRPDDVTGLLQRGIFAPATFGRLRFYHRSAQEYLTACWIQRLQPPDSELYAIFLADVFGVRTVPPSLRASAAWIAMRHAGLREHLLEREPLVLLAEGDPGALAIPDRIQLLGTFAAHQRAGLAPYQMIDNRALWMFADPALAAAILDALEANDRPEFQLEMVHIVELGKIAGCRDAMRRIANDIEADALLRLYAVHAMAMIDDDEGLCEVASKLRADPGPLDGTLARALALSLFPEFLSIDDLLGIIRRTRQVEDFRRDKLITLFEACPDLDTKEAFVCGLADLAFEPPLGDWPRISQRYATLVEQLGSLARAAVLAFDGRPLTDGLVRLIRAVAMSEEGRHEGPTLRSLVAARPELKHAVFLADLAVATETRRVRYLHQVSFLGNVAWSISQEDGNWLEGLLSSGNESQRLVALDALYRLSRQENSAIDGDQLVAKVEGEKLLADALADVRRPAEPIGEEWRDMRDIKRTLAENETKAAERKNAARVSILAFRDTLKSDPGQLCDSDRLKKWPGSWPLVRLTDWLRDRKVGSGYDGAALRWRMLESAFGREIAEAYRQGITRLWRLTPAQRPTITERGYTNRYDVVLSFAGIGVEAGEDPDWADRLTPAEATRAAEHACLDAQNAPVWLETLLERYPALIVPHVEAEMSREWRNSVDHAPFLERAAHRMRLVPLLQRALARVIAGDPPRNVKRVETAAEIVGKLDLTVDESTALLGVTQGRLKSARAAGDREAVISYLRLLFRLEADAGVAALDEIIDGLEASGQWDTAFTALRSLFDRDSGSIVDPAILGPTVLARLVERAYGIEVRIARETTAADDDDEDRSFDIHGPRNALLSGLVHLDGENAYEAICKLAERPSMAQIAHHIRERARQIAERAAERPPWSEADVVAFETSRLAPITRGDDLLVLVRSLIDAINWEFRKADMSARAVVETARDEEAVQEWLGSILELKGGGRFRCTREAQVADNRRPDIIVTATRAPVEVAIELKHDDKGWTLPDLSDALSSQLAERYLQPANRRHGVLVVTNHRDARFWRDHTSGKGIPFGTAIERLQAQAATIHANSSGPIEVAVHGIDAAPSRRQVAAPKDGRPKVSETAKLGAKKTGPKSGVPAATRRMKLTKTPG